MPPRHHYSERQVISGAHGGGAGEEEAELWSRQEKWGKMAISSP